MDVYLTRMAYVLPAYRCTAMILDDCRVLEDKSEKPALRIGIVDWVSLCTVLEIVCVPSLSFPLVVCRAK